MPPVVMASSVKKAELASATVVSSLQGRIGLLNMMQGSVARLKYALQSRWHA